MRDIVDLTVTQVRIYQTDVLPFSEIRLTTNVKTIKEAFQFENVQSDLLGVQLTFTNGVFENHSKPVHILTLSFDQRRSQLQVRGTSSQADAFYAAVTKLLESLLKRTRVTLGEPLLKAEDTACVAALDIDFEDLIAPPLLRFVLGEVKTKLKTPYGTPKSITFKNLSFEIRYTPNPSLEEHEVNLNNKLLTIEPRL